MIKTGIRIVRENPKVMESWGRFGLVANQASVDHDFEPTWRILDRITPGRLQALFGPQHGFEATVQDNMIETGHGKHLATGLPVFSLYSETRKPTSVMLADIDTIVIDLQITGCRVYTFKWTIAECLRAAKDNGKTVVVLDRPNPLGGEYVEGRVLDADCYSFVGQDTIPMRHALTPGELAKFVNRSIGCRLEVVELEDWNPCSSFYSTGLPWVITSPNLPTLDSIMVYPGTVLFEGTNVSEGRGTALPFQFIGSPYLKDPHALIEYLNKWPSYLDGVFLRPCSFMPTSQKWAKEECLGLQIHVEDPYEVRSYKLALMICNAFYTRKGFEWAKPGYEYDFDALPINLIIGSKSTIDHFGDSFDPADPFWDEGLESYVENIKPYLLYDRDMKIP